MQQFACKAAEFGELAAAFAQHCKQYATRFRAATANRADPEKHQPAGLGRPLEDTANRGEILTLVQRSVTGTVWRIGAVREATGTLHRRR